MNDTVQVRNLKKNFKVAKSGSGFLTKFKQFVIPQHESLPAVDDISFEIRRGEKVAFIGPNGAGKSTTIKLLTGIYQPCSGSVRIFDKDPYVDRKSVAYKIGTVFGQRSQLWYHLPAYHSFTLLATIYDIDPKKFKERLDHLIEVFQLRHFISRPVKELSLGERMRCELVASLLHNPEVLFLDEPTIGLDIISKDAIRHLIQQRAELESTTIFLTSHDIADIEKVCDRIILINKGKIVIDDSVKSIKKQYLKNKVITVKSEKKIEWKSHPAISPIHAADSFYKFEIDLCLMNPQEAVQYFAQNYRFTDIVIEDPPLEEIIKGIYQS
ncbi:MAG: ATP-binding cassette domain-containing protein [Verrucomicrobia bacterium]|nr:ATP-binding cassette domain-containing protein [Verrucomicrobiota bacterium]